MSRDECSECEDIQSISGLDNNYLTGMYIRNPWKSV